MNLSSLPLVGNLNFSLILTSLILGMTILILVEKRKFKQRQSERKTTELSSAIREDTSKTLKVEDIHHTMQNSYKDSLSNKLKISGSVEQEDAIQDEKVEERRDSTCSSSADEEAGKQKRVRKIHRKKNSGDSAEEGGTKTCSKKKAVTVLTILTDTEDEQVKKSLEEFGEQFRTGDLTCTIRAVHRDDSWPVSNASTDLHLFLLTRAWTDQGPHLEVASGEQPPTFLYSVAGLAGSHAEQITQCCEELAGKLSESGGTEWLPITNISLDDDAQHSSITAQQYINKVVKKVNKSSKKCCGSTCSSKKKTVDIEDLVMSQLPEIMVAKAYGSLSVDF